MELNKSRKIIVIGHKNPDTDSICSAIAYAELMNKVAQRKADGEKEIPVYEACRAGTINPETSFVLDLFGREIPRLCLDVRGQVADLDIRTAEAVSPNSSLRETWESMKKQELTTLPVLNENHSLEGLIGVKDIAMATMDALDSSIFATNNVPVRNVLSTIEGELVCGDPDACVSKGRIRIGASNPESVEQNFEKSDIVIIGNRAEILRLTVNLGSSVIIVCMCDGIEPEIAELAKEKGCTLIRTPLDTYTASRLLGQSVPVSNYMTTEITSFSPSDSVDDVREVMSRYRHDYFPVIEKNKVYGLISKRNLISLRKKQLVLVDHNEKSQCVDGFEEAEILAIVDHHRIGDLETTGPVEFRNVPVGCTATIITDMYHEYGIEIEPKTAGILCCAILSDTLAFRSPTCTQKDIDTAKELAAIVNIDCQKLADSMFDAGEDLRGKSPEAIFRNDYKVLRSGNLRIAISQGTFNSPANHRRVKEIMQESIRSFLRSEDVDLAFYIATAIQEKSSDVICAGDGAEDLVRRSFETEDGGIGIRVPGLVSRKKQFVPAILNTLQEM